MSSWILNRSFSEHEGYPDGIPIPDYGFVQSIYFKGKEDKKCVQITDRTLKLNYFIGVDWVNKFELTIYVGPKVNSESRLTNYLEMLFQALKDSEVAEHTEDLFEIKFDDPYIEISQEQDLLAPLIVVQFLRIVKSIVKKGLKKSYYRIEQNLNGRVKGKVLVSKTIKSNLLKSQILKTQCTFDEFGVNGLENRLLKRALVFVQRYLPSIRNINSEKYTHEVFSYILPAFESVSEEVGMNDIKHSRINAFYKEYNEGTRLAKIILRRFGYNLTNANPQKKINTPPFWIDMSKLFELYVLGLLKDKFRYEIVYQYGENRKETTYGIPDFLLTTPGGQMIIDAKYKVRYQAEKITFDEYLIKDIWQLSGYARDKSILNRLNLAESKVIDCLIIFPENLESSSQDTGQNKIDLSQKSEIEQFANFYKLPVKLPTINPNQRFC